MRDIGVNVIRREITRVGLPDQRGKIGEINWQVTNFQNVEVLFGNPIIQTHDNKIILLM